MTKAIKTRGLTKTYKLYSHHSHRLKEALHLRRKAYHRLFYALNNIHLEVPAGEILGIIGRNGAGKSTLLKILAGVLTPSKGWASVKGNISSLLELGTGFNPELTGMENIYLNGAIMGYPRKKLKPLIPKIMDFADIGDYMNQPLRTYSSGMKARLGFAVAVNINPDVLLLDEILAVGDEMFKRKCFAFMENFFKSRKTVVIASHSLSQIIELCQRAILLDAGEIILEGTPYMVAMQYRKLILADKEKQAVIRKDIVQLNADPGKKRKLEARILKEEKADDEKNFPPQVEKLPSRSNQQPYFIQNFTPASTVVHQNADVRIKEIFIKTLRGNPVNALVLNETYTMVFHAEFGISASGVTFGFNIKNMKGLGISGIRIPEDGSTIDMGAGESCQAEWNFHCLLRPGTYFINLDVMESSQAGKNRLIHIADAYSFRVQNSQRKFAGLVNLHSQGRIIPFSGRHPECHVDKEKAFNS